MTEILIHERRILFVAQEKIWFEKRGKIELKKFLDPLDSQNSRERIKNEKFYKTKAFDREVDGKKQAIENGEKHLKIEKIQ